MAETCSPETRCLFVETNLDTRLGILVHDHETISGFKEKLSKDHKQCFPQVGEIDISAIKQRKHFHHLPDVMVLSKAFAGRSKNWYMYVDAAARVDKCELPRIVAAGQNCSNHELIEGKKEIANDTLLLDGYKKNQALEERFETEVAEKTSKKRKLKSSDGEKSRKKRSVDLNQSVAAATTASGFDVDGSRELPGNVQVEVVASESSPREKLDDTRTGATGKEVEMGEKSVEDVGTDKIETDNLVKTRPDTEKRKKLKKRSKDDINQSSAAAITTSRDIVNGAPANVDRVDATPETLPVERGNPHSEASQKENEMVEKETKKKRKKSSKDDINQSSAAATTTPGDIVNEVNGVHVSVERVDATPESLPISGGNPFSKASQKENEMVENSVDDVGRDKIETENLASHTANHLDSNNLEKETKKKRKKSSKAEINQSSAAAATTSRDIVNEINGVAGNVDIVNATPEPLPISRGETRQTEYEMVEKSVRDSIETDDPSSHPTNHLDADSGLTTRPDTEKKNKRKKRSKDDIDQSSAAVTTTSRDIVDEINGVPANVDRVDATSESLPISRSGNLGNPIAESKQKENKMDEKINDDVGNREAIPSTADNMETNNVEIDAGEAKSLKSTKKKKSKKAKTPAAEDTPVASDAQNVEPIKAVDEEGPDNVIRNILDSLQENETEENLEKTGKKSSKKSKKKHSLKVAESEVLPVEVNKAALEETPPINNPKDTDVLLTPAKKDTESDASLLKKSTEVADNAEENSLFKKIPTEKADTGDNFGPSQKDDSVANGKKEDQVAGEAKSKKEKKSLDLHPSGSVDGSLCSMKPKERKGRDQPAGSDASHLQSMVKKNDRSGSGKVSANSKKEDVKESSKSFVVDMSQTNFFKDAEDNNSTEDDSKTSNVSTRTPSDNSSSDDDSDVTSMSRKQGNNLAGGTNKFSGSLQDILRRSSSYKKALQRASQSQADSSDDESPALDCVPDSQAV